MSGLSLVSAQLEASLVDVEKRTAEGLLVPFGEPGRTNLGAGVRVLGATFPPDGRVIGIVGHDRERPVSRLVAHEVRPDGIWGRLKVAATPAGDVLLAEIREGIRDGLSVEMSDLTFDAAGDITDGLLEFVAHVPKGAYSSARVHQLAAVVHHPTPTDGDSVTELAPAPEPTMTPSAPAPALDLNGLADLVASRLTAAAAPGGLSLGSAPTAPAAPAETASDVDRLVQLQAAQYTSGGDRTLMAALADITNSDLPIFQRPAGAIPQQLWANSGYTRRFVPLLTAKPLTSMTYGGWEFTQGPEVGDWSGDKTEIPTNEVATREITGTAARMAGGWDIDRKYRDFGDQAFWSAFYAAQTESYARRTDAKAAAAIVAAAQDVTGTSPVTGYTRPTGFGTVGAQADVLRAVAFGTAYLEETPLIEQGPDFVLMNTEDYMSLLGVASLDVPAFLDLFGVTPSNFRRTNRVPAGSIILGVKRALEWYELPGAAPIRVEALDVARGGIDSAVYGYWGTLHVRPGGIISVPLA